MGIPNNTSLGTPPAGDQANAVVLSSFTATGDDSAFPFWGWFNAVVYGAFTGTAVLNKSFDGGTTWVPATAFGATTALSLTAPGAALIFEPEQGVLYRWSSSAFTSGTINCRLSTTGGAARAWVPNR